MQHSKKYRNTVGQIVAFLKIVLCSLTAQVLLGSQDGKLVHVSEGSAHTDDSVWSFGGVIFCHSNPKQTQKLNILQFSEQEWFLSFMPNIISLGFNLAQVSPWLCFVSSFVRSYYGCLHSYVRQLSNTLHVLGARAVWCIKPRECVPYRGQSWPTQHSMEACQTRKCC